MSGVSRPSRPSREDSFSLESYIRRYEQLNPKTSTEPLLQPYEVKEAFQKYLMHKIISGQGETKELDPILATVWKELESCSSVIPSQRLNRLAYLVHTTSSERELLWSMIETPLISQASSLNPKLFALGFHQIANDFTRWELASHLKSCPELEPHFTEALQEHPLNEWKKEKEKMERDLAEIPDSSLFKQYLLSGQALDEKKKIQYVLQVLSRSLKIDLDESEDLKTWNEKILSALYSRFLHVLETGTFDAHTKRKFNRINKTKKSLEQKIEETLTLLYEMTGASGVQKLKDALCMKVEEKDLGDFPEVGLIWNPDMPLLKQRDPGFHSLCLSMLLEISRKRGISIDQASLLKAQKRSDFSGLKEAALQMPKLEERIRDQVIKMREDLDLQTSSATSTYDLYDSFKEEFKKRYLALKERVQLNELQSLLLEQAYLNQNTHVLVKIERKFPPCITTDLDDARFTPDSSPTTTTAETVSVASIDLPSPGNPELIKNIQTFNDWIHRNDDSVLGDFVFQKQPHKVEVDEFQSLEVARWTLELYTDQLRQEASMMKESFPKVLSNLNELEIFSAELAYKKFLKGLRFVQSKYQNSDILGELQRISHQHISIQEKRVLSMQKLIPYREEAHLGKLLHCLVSLFNDVPSTSLKDLEMDAFSAQKTKNAVFKWLSNGSFFKSLEIEIGAKNNPKIEIALKIFTSKIKDRMNLLQMPPIYFSLVDSFIKKGHLAGLKQMFYILAYRKYIQAVRSVKYPEGTEVLQHLLQFDAELKVSSTVERVEVTKHKLREALKDEDLLNYLLFQLEQLSYGGRNLSDQSKESISDYLQEKNSIRPFDHYLQENRFSWLGYTEDHYNWFAYLYEQFIKNITNDAKRSRYETTRLLTLEIENLSPFDLPKLDQLAMFIRASRAVTLEELYRFGFIFSVEEALKNPQLERNHQKNFESIENISTQTALLDHLSRSFKFSNLVHSTLTNGSPRSLDVGYNFLKEVMKQPEISNHQGGLHAFFAVHFLGYSQDWVDYISKEGEEELEKLEKFESLMQGELFHSPLKELLQKDGLINPMGRSIGLFSLMPLCKLEPYIRTLKTFGEVNLGFKVPSPYLSPDSWSEVLTSVNQLLVKKTGVSCFPEQVKKLIEECLSSPGSFSDCLRTFGIRQLPGMGSDGYYQDYLLLEGQVFQYFVSKIGELKKTKEKLFDILDIQNNRKMSTLKKILDLLLTQANLLQKRLKIEIESRKWQQVNQVTDQIVYIESKVSLIELIICEYPMQMARPLKDVLPEREGVQEIKERIEIFLNNLPDFLSAEHRNNLQSILRNESWLKNSKFSIDQKWSWALDKVYLKNFPDVQVDSSNLTLYEKQAILDNIFCALAESLLKEIQDLGMDQEYKKLIKIAYYEDCLFLWDWIVEEVSYQKYLLEIEKAKNEGENMSMFDDLESSTENCTIHEKTALVLRTLEEHQESSACRSITSSIKGKEFIWIEPYSLIFEE